MNKKKTIIQILDQVNVDEKRVLQEMPHELSCLIGNRHFTIAGNEVCLSNDGDYMSIEKCRIAITWLVEQFGGTVQWKA